MNKIIKKSIFYIFILSVLLLYVFLFMTFISGKLSYSQPRFYVYLFSCITYLVYNIVNKNNPNRNKYSLFGYILFILEAILMFIFETDFTYSYINNLFITQLACSTLLYVIAIIISNEYRPILIIILLLMAGTGLFLALFHIVYSMHNDTFAYISMAVTAITTILALTIVFKNKQLVAN